MTEAEPPRDSPWADPPEIVLRALGTDPARGLSESEARARLRRYGPNRLRQARRRSRWRILWDQLASLIVGLLSAAAAVAFAFGEYEEAGAIAAVIALNTVIGFVTEARAIRSMEALRKLGHATAHVRRDGAVHAMPAETLVPGDVLVLEAGDVLSADARLLEASRLQADESALTGESLPVDKRSDAVDVAAPLPERGSMLFKGTALTRGSAEAVIVATGMATVLGEISALVETAEPETTPLEQRLDRLARRLVGLTLAIAAAVAGLMLATGRDPYLAVEIAIALAVAAIPEGLPIVATVALARGMWRMARRNALVERLSAVETLGSTTVILTDKTGTLTENRMAVVELRLAAGPVRVETGGETEGDGAADGFFSGTRALELDARPDLADTLRVAVLCNNATLSIAPGGAQEATGDPTEVALLRAGARAGLQRDALLRACPEVGEIAFDAESKRMATLHAADGAVQAAVKGAPETLLEACTRVRTPQGSEPLDASGRTRWLTAAHEMAATGERVLALARGTTASAQDFAFRDLELLALVGLFDPPREHVREALDACRRAGIRVAMVTGDHGATAWNVAAAVGLVAEAPPAPLDARELPPAEKLSDAQREALLGATVIARATPRQKLDLIELYQRAGHVVAMTGDGVNDAPALKKADIGVAMGLRGTAVAREAADIVLRDDELGTIVRAVAHGRAIFGNIRTFVVYLMSCNVSEILAVALGAIASGPLPLLPLQILFLNLVTDVFPALALGVGEGSAALMDDPPRDPREPVLRRVDWRLIFGLGVTIALSVMAALAASVFWLGRTGRAATTIAFLTLALAQLWHVFSMRHPASGWLRNEITRNPWMWGALALCVGLLLGAVYWPPLAAVLSLVDPGPRGWLVALAASLAPLAVGQLALRTRRRAATPSRPV